jgi:hypothetical protein
MPCPAPVMSTTLPAKLDDICIPLGGPLAVGRFTYLT